MSANVSPRAREQPVQQGGVLVGHAARVGFEPPGGRELIAVERAELDVGIADVDGEQQAAHAASVAAHAEAVRAYHPLACSRRQRVTLGRACERQDVDDATLLRRVAARGLTALDEPARAGGCRG